MHTHTHSKAEGGERPRAHTRVGEDESEERRSAVDAAALASVFKAKHLSKKPHEYIGVYIQ